MCKWVARTPRSALVHGGVGRTHTFSISEMSSVTAFEKGLRIIITSLPRGRAPPRATSGCAYVKGGAPRGRACAEGTKTKAWLDERNRNRAASKIRRIRETRS